MWLLKFIGWSLLKCLIIMLSILVVTMIVCIIINNGLTGSWTSFINSVPFLVVAVWVTWWLTLFGRADLQGILLGIIVFYLPLILLTIVTPDPPVVVDLLDDKGNIWTLTKNS